MEKEFIKTGPVLDKKGRPYPGYSKDSILEYDRRAIKAPPWRIKEWDFYQVTDGEKCLQFTIGHASYAGQICVMLFDFKTGEKLLEKNIFLVLPFNKLHMPSNAEKDGDLSYHKKGAEIHFITRGDQRLLTCKWDDFESNIILTRKNPHSLVINIPFDEYEHAFYYNQKINCMAAEGYAKFNGKKYNFNGDNSFGLLDWGRGVWPFHNEWYWSNGSGYVDGEIFGFNLGCGFGNTENATENILFYKGETHKLGRVKFELGKEYMNPWHIHDEEGRLNLILTPTYDRTTVSKVLWVNNCCHQMFGSFQGEAVLDDGTHLTIDQIISFAEHAVNNW